MDDFKGQFPADGIAVQNPAAVDGTRPVVTDEQNVVDDGGEQLFQAGIGAAGYGGKKNPRLFQAADLGKILRVQFMASIRNQGAVYIGTDQFQHASASVLL